MFAGAGGLSEGFIKAGFSPIAHIEMKKDACNTLKTRSAFTICEQKINYTIYKEYLKNKGRGLRRLCFMEPGSSGDY